MPHIVSIIPGTSSDGKPIALGTKVLLSNGEYLQGIMSVQIEIKPNDCWKAFIEVIPSKQDEVRALLDLSNNLQVTTSKNET